MTQGRRAFILPTSDAEAFADAYVLLHEGALVMRQVMGQKTAAALALPLVDELLASRLSS